MVLLLVAVAWLGAALLTATLFALLARAGRSDDLPELPTLPQQRSATTDVRSLQSQR